MIADIDPRKKFRRIAVVLAALALSVSFVACGGDDGDDEEAVSAETVTVTTSDTADGYEWDVSPTPTADTTSVEFVNDSNEFHALVFARLGEGYTIDEAYELQGEKGSAISVAKDLEGPPGETATTEVNEPIEPGEYVLLCPIPGKDGPHYKLGQLAEFTIE